MYARVHTSRPDDVPHRGTPTYPTVVLFQCDSWYLVDYIKKISLQNWHYSIVPGNRLWALAVQVPEGGRLHVGDPV